MSLVTSLRDEVICTTCLALPRVSVFQCENGHLICKDCFHKCSSFCPTCKKPMVNKIRSIIAEKILSLMPLPCKYNDHGCEEELYKEKLDEHEKVCLYRPICCVDIACNAKVPFANMLDHMAKDHESGDFVHANGNNYKSYFIVNEDDFSREIMWISDHLTLDDRHFFRECCRSPNGKWHVWIYLLGSEKEAINYSTVIKIVLPSTEEELIYKGRVNALNSSNRQSPIELSGLTFPDCVARKFWENKRIHYEVQIEKNPPKKIIVKKKKSQEAATVENKQGGKKEDIVEAAQEQERKNDAEAQNENNPGTSESSVSSSTSSTSSTSTKDEEAQPTNQPKNGEEKVKKGETKKKSSKNDKKEDVRETSC